MTIKTTDIIPCSSTHRNTMRVAKELPARLKEISANTIRIVEGAVYHGSQKKINVVCMKCGHKWASMPSNLINHGTGCPECKRQKSIKSAGTRRAKRADTSTKQKAAELRALGWTYSAIATEVGFVAKTVMMWLDEEHRQKNIKAAREYNNKTRGSEHRRQGKAEYYQTPQGKATSRKGKHKRRSLQYHAVDAIYVGIHPDADHQGFVEVDMWSYITPKDYDFWSFEGADEDVAKRAKQQVGLEKISGEKYSLEHLVPLSKGGLHHPLNFANRALALNTQKNNQMLKEDVRLFATRLFN